MAGDKGLYPHAINNLFVSDLKHKLKPPKNVSLKYKIKKEQKINDSSKITALWLADYLKCNIT